MQTIWQDRDNTIDLALELDGEVTNAPAALDATNKLYLLLRDLNGVETAFNSLSNPSYFEIATRRVGAQQLRVFSIGLGNAALATGEYECVVTLYDAIHTQGLVISEFRAQVRDAT
jgi:hypothetical protein